MEPYNQQQSPPPEHNPYGFIMDTQHQPQKKAPLGSQNSLMTRILIAGGGVFLLLIIFILVNALVFNKKDPSAVLLISIAADQQEISRLSETGIAGATDPSTKNYVETVKLTTITQQLELSAYLAKNKVKPLPSELAAKKDTQVDALLTAATKSNRFNEAFDEQIRKNLTVYKNDLEKGYNNASNATSKALLKKAFNSTADLLK